MKKNLKSLTIIPPEIYIKRDADRQVRQIVNDMGRPGYVLVARQMGKTNLLLNVKREFHNLEDLFVYVDVSNIFPTLRAFFRNIIDTAVSGIAESSGLMHEIASRRLKTVSFPEHQEHESELAFLLTKLPGTLVVCLDEVDALVKTGFSDNVFSFIRSVYFSGRVNIPSFSRLTYLLSGVAEPTELIKNKSISPFNIGAKIYLEDFSESELRELAAKSTVVIPDDVVGRVYYWTSGHPRLSYEVTSSVEDRLIAGQHVDPRLVDQIVQDSYLTHFDLPPIDHIRTLVQDDQEIRDAIMAVHYGRSEAVPANIRTRLYLNGIIGNQIASGAVSLKNRIIETALSEDWLRGVDDARRSAFDRAQAAFAKNNYKEAAAFYREYLSTTSDRSAKILALSPLGFSLMRLEQYEDAIRALEEDPITIDDSLAGFVFNRINLGACHLVLGKTTQAREFFEEVIECGDKPQTRPQYIQSLINIASIDSQNLPENSDSVMRSCDFVIDLIKNDLDVGREKDVVRILLAAFYLKHKVFAAKNDISLAVGELNSAIDRASGSEKITLNIILAAYLLEVKPDFGLADLKSVVILIDDVRPRLRSPSALEQFALTEEKIVHLLLMISRLKDSEELTGKLIKYLSSPAVTPDQSYRIVISCVLNNHNLYAREQMVALLICVIRGFGEPDFLALRRYGLLILSIVNVEAIDDEMFRTLVSSLEKGRVHFDINSLWMVIAATRSLVSFRTIQESRKLVETIMESVQHQHALDEEFRAAGVLGLLNNYFSFLIEERADNYVGAENYAKSFGECVRALPAHLAYRYIPKNVLTSMTATLQRFAPTTGPVPVKRASPKIGRNDWVSVRLPSGEVKHGKYKKIARLLLEEGGVLMEE